MIPIVLVLTGTPGTGKTTITNEVSKEGYFSLSLSEFADQNNCNTGFDERRKVKIVDTDKLREVLENYLNTMEGIVLVEGHYADALPIQYVNRCFVLNTPPKILRVRLDDRGYEDKKIEENVLAEIMQVCYVDALDAFGISKVTKIDNMSIKAIKDLILTYIFVLENTK